MRCRNLRFGCCGYLHILRCRDILECRSDGLSDMCRGKVRFGCRGYLYVMRCRDILECRSYLLRSVQCWDVQSF
jgi:hypothetical protein